MSNWQLLIYRMAQEKRLHRLQSLKIWIQRLLTVRHADSPTQTQQSKRRSIFLILHNTLAMCRKQTDTTIFGRYVWFVTAALNHLRQAKRNSPSWATSISPAHPGIMSGRDVPTVKYL